MCLAIPGKILSIEKQDDPVFCTGTVSFDGIERIVNLSLVPEAQVDDYVIVHVGVALNRINEEAARQTMRYLKEMGEYSPDNPGS